MSAFLTTLQVEEVEDRSHDGRGTWKLLQPLAFQSDVAGKTIVAPAGFVTDYASVPRVPFAYWIAGDRAHPAAVIHDWLYTSHLVDRATADAVLEEAANAADCLSDPGPNALPDVVAQTAQYNAEVRTRNRLMKWAVRLFGGGHWNAPGPVQPVDVQKAAAAASVAATT